MRCLDANVWIYYLDTTLPEHERVVESVRSILQTEPVFTTTVLQMEVVHYVYTQFENVAETLDQFLQLEDVVVADLIGRDVERGTELLRTWPNAGIGGRDATVIAAMERYDVDHLWTHDTGFQRIGDELDWLEVADPVDS